MLPRLIPLLLIDRHRRVVKTVGFGERTYIGDPFNIIRLFNEKEVDELCVLDIDASADGRAPDHELAAALAGECFMPLSFGGGIATLEQARTLINLGIEKLVLRTHATDALIAAVAHEFGAQAVVGCVDYVGSGDTAKLRSSGAPLAQEIGRMASAGVGEIILQSVDRDGLRTGMDVATISSAAASVAVPLVALGGAGDVAHLDAAIAAGADAAASGSAFCFIGPRRAVLVTYPAYEDRCGVTA
jgi:imidazole glycerol-phosphate synthase subunit HisF